MRTDKRWSSLCATGGRIRTFSIRTGSVRPVHGINTGHLTPDGHFPIRKACRELTTQSRCQCRSWWLQRTTVVRWAGLSHRQFAVPSAKRFGVQIFRQASGLICLSQYDHRRTRLCRPYFQRPNPSLRFQCSGHSRLDCPATHRNPTSSSTEQQPNPDIPVGLAVLASCQKRPDR